MSPKDRLVNLMKEVRPKLSHIDVGSVDHEIQLANHNRTGEALKQICEDMKRYKVPLSSEEWNNIRKLERDFHVHVVDLRHLVA